MKIYKLFAAIIAVSLILGVTACQSSTEQPEDNAVITDDAEQEPENPGTAPENTERETVSILVAAAASLEYSYEDKLIPLFQDQYPWITVEGVYDSSGKLQTQVEQGLHADVFMSASPIQMNALAEQNLVQPDSIRNVLENKIVLIALTEDTANYSNFEDISKASIVALGDPASVPAGQYAKEALRSLDLWNEIEPKVHFGSNVTEVLNWVASGSAEVGIVYATDAKTNENIVTIAEAPNGTAEKVLYPAGIVAATQNEEAAVLFLEFLTSQEALAIFAGYGFSPAQ